MTFSTMFQLAMGIGSEIPLIGLIFDSLNHRTISTEHCISM